LSMKVRIPGIPGSKEKTQYCVSKSPLYTYNWVRFYSYLSSIFTNMFALQRELDWTDNLTKKRNFGKWIIQKKKAIFLFVICHTKLPKGVTKWIFSHFLKKEIFYTKKFPLSTALQCVSRIWTSFTWNTVWL
jgi:hypothetical protein